MTPADLAAKGLRVKPLVWVAVETHGGQCLDAVGCGQVYRIIRSKFDGKYWLTWPDLKRDNIDAVKAAAEAHHAARVAEMIEAADG
jgi:hypothetical protein